MIASPYTKTLSEGVDNWMDKGEKSFPLHITAGGETRKIYFTIQDQSNAIKLYHTAIYGNEAMRIVAAEMLMEIKELIENHHLYRLHLLTGSKKAITVWYVIRDIDQYYERTSQTWAECKKSVILPVFNIFKEQKQPIKSGLKRDFFWIGQDAKVMIESLQKEIEFPFHETYRHCYSIPLPDHDKRQELEDIRSFLCNFGYNICIR